MRAQIRDLSRAESEGPAQEKALFLRILLWALGFKILIALVLPLGLDEAYAIAVAREYSLSFFDHPPLSFWAPVAMADLTGIEHPMIYRLPFLLAGVLTTGLMFLIGREIKDSRTGVWSALLYTLAPFFMVSGGIVAVPDGLLNLGSAATVYLLLRIVKQTGVVPVFHWVWVGLALAFALASKYQAAWIPLAVLMFMALTPKGRQWFFQIGPWLGGILGLLGLFPIIYWNLSHDWASFAFHGGRAGGGIDMGNWAEMAATQALFLLPTSLYAGAAGIGLTLTRRENDAQILLALISLGPILIFNGIYLFSSGSLAHWAMPGWQFALPLAAVWITGKGPDFLRRFLVWSLAIFAVVWLGMLTLVIHADTGFLTRFAKEIPKWDRTLSVFNYRDLGPELKKRGIWRDTDLFIATSWSGAGIFDTALKSEKPMRVFDKQAAHHFSFLTDATATGRAIYLETGLLDDVETIKTTLLRNARKLDQSAELLPVFALKRGNRDYVYVVMVRLEIK